MNYATFNGNNLHISFKQSVDLCNMVRGRDIDTAIKWLEEVINLRRVVKMNTRQVGHQHGPRIMAAGRPITAAKEFLRMAKSLKANALNHELELEKYVVQGVTNKAPFSWKSGGRTAKRCHVMLKLILNNKYKTKGKK